MPDDRWVLNLLEWLLYVSYSVMIGKALTLTGVWSVDIKLESWKTIDW